MKKVLLIAALIMLMAGMVWAVENAKEEEPIKASDDSFLAANGPAPSGGMLLGGGPDAFGYIWKDSRDAGGPVFSWVDISGIGTEITPWPHGSVDDGYTDLIPMGITFNYYGIDYTEATVSTNGWVSFGSQISSYLTNAAIPAVALPNTIIAPLWDDLDGGTIGHVYYYNDVAQNQFIVSWVNWPYYPDPIDPKDFQVILDSDDSTIVFQYGAGTFSQTDISVGIENETGTIGLRLAYNTAYPINNLATKFSRPPLLAHNVGVNSILSPGATTYKDTSYVVSCNVRNFGLNTETNLLVRYQIFDSTGAVVYNNTHSIPSIASETDSVVIFPAWVPAEANRHTLKAFTSLAGDLDRTNDTTYAITNTLTHRGNGGPAEYWYFADNITGGGPAFNWIDITGVGEFVSFGSQDDANSGLADMGMTFNFFGNTYSQLAISTNGWMSFTDGSTTGLTNTVIPATGAPNTIIALLWDDLHIGSGGVYRYYDSAENRYIVQYNNVEFYPSGGPDCMDIEVILDGTANTIKMQYNNFCDSSQADISIGIENSTGTVGLAYDNSGELLQRPYNGVAVTWTYSPPTNDVGVNAILNPGPTALVGYALPVSARVHNFGSANQVTVPVRYTISDSLGGNVYFQTINAVNVAAGEDTTITFPNWTPSVAGPYAIAAFTFLGGDFNIHNDTTLAATRAYQHRSSGGPVDNWSYIDNLGGGPAFNWIDITAIGTPVTFSSVDNGYSGFIDMGMSFSFYGEVYDRVALCTNGWMSFIDSTSTVRIDTLMPMPIVPNALIAFLWDDLHMGTGAAYYYFDSVNNQFIVQYNNVEFYPLGGGDCIDMEVILNGTTGAIKMQYNNFCLGSQTDISIGIENQGGTLGLPYNNHGEIGQTPINELAITYTYTFLTHDMAAVGFVGLPGSGSVGAPITPQVTFRNNSSSTETNIPVRLQITPGTYDDVQTIPSLAPGVSATVTFANFTPPSGNLYTLTATAQLPSDLNHANDVVIAIYNVYDVLYDFEGGSGGFTATGNWEWGSPSSGPGAAYSGVNCWATNLAGNYTTGLSELTFNLTLGTTSPAISFTHWYDTEVRYDGCNFAVSTDNGSSWNVVSPVDGYDDTSYTANPLYPDSIFTGHVHSFWEIETFPLTAFAGQSVMARLALGADGSVYYPGWYVDDLGLTDCSLAAPEMGLNPTTLQGSAQVGNADSDQLTISNSGTYTLNLDAAPHILPPAALATLSMTPERNNAAISRQYNVKYETPSDETKPEQEVILQGGDDIANATVIPSLPYNDAGTTAGYINDYDEACPGGTGSAPDVVYAYAPSADQFVTISLCGSTFDTKLIIYANEYTPGSPLDCDDDGCPVGLQSEIIGLGLTGGVTYYIVVDGYGSASGDYTLDMLETPPPPGCPAENVIFGQAPTTPSEAWTFATTDLEPNYIRYESFVNFYGDVSEIHFWGIDAYNNGSTWSECDEDPAAVQINFYSDNNGLPGAVVATYDVNISPVATGQTYYGAVAFAQKEYVATFSPAVSMYEGWISIQGISSGDNCWLLWQNSLAGEDGSSLLFDGSTYTVEAFDLSLCLVGTPRTPWLSIDNTHLDIAPGNSGIITANMSAVNLTAGTYDGYIRLLTNDPDEGRVDVPVTFTVIGGGSGCNYVVGDINGNGTLNGIDVSYGVGYFKGGPLPPYSCECTPGNTWFVAGDVNASCVFNGIDITYLVSYFKGGAAPRSCASCPPALQSLPVPGTPLLAPSKVNNLESQQ